MLKSFQFVDPLLAQRIHSLQIQLKKLRQTKEDIHNNSKLMKGIKQKLIKYHSECEQNTKRMLNQQRDKLAQYLDQQTNIITKTNRQCSYKQVSKYNNCLNQSTRIDLSIDDSKSVENIVKTQRHNKVSSFFVSNSPNMVQTSKRTAKVSSIKIKKLSKKVQQQSKMIKMLISWIRIYHQRQTQYQNLINSQNNDQQELRRQNIILQMKITKLQDELNLIKTNFNNKSNTILQYQKKYEQIRQENDSLMLQRRSLINQVKSCRKYNKKIEIC